jgi:hypothetical protein
MPAQLLPAAALPPIDRPVADCRIYERKSCELPTTCQPASALEMKEMRWAATIVDISLGGVRILLQRRFEKGSGLAIELPGDEQREPTVVFVKVVHVRADANGAWALGCRFLSELSEDELQRLLTATHHVLSSSKEEYSDEESNDDEEEAHVPASSPTNQIDVKFLPDVHLLVETQSGTITECMVKRLNVSKCWPLTAGKILSLNGKTSEQTPWSLRIQIISCSPQGKGWEIQGRLVGPSNAAETQQSLGTPDR